MSSSGCMYLSESSAILNPNGGYYELLKRTFDDKYEDNYWAEDAVFMERNSRDFVHRIERINVNAEAVCELLTNSALSRCRLLTFVILV